MQVRTTSADQRRVSFTHRSALHRVAQGVSMEGMAAGEFCILLSACCLLACQPNQMQHALSTQNDVLAGLAVGVMAVPQCVSFALMAGLPSVYGLYSAFLPIVAYALTGSSPQLVTISSSDCFLVHFSKKSICIFLYCLLRGPNWPSKGAAPNPTAAQSGPNVASK